jgi:predicted O-methyltransferase YrrM
MLTRAEFFIKLIKENNYRDFAEIGMGEGDLARILLKEVPFDHYIMVEHDVTKRMYGLLLDTDWHEYNKEVPIVFMRMRSMDAAKIIKDESIDIVFIDAEHCQPGVEEYVESWKSKVRKGGILCGHDYNLRQDISIPVSPASESGVAPAVNKLFKEFNLEPVDVDNCIWWIKI